MIKIRQTGIDLGKINFDFHKQLNEMAKIVKSDISETVRSGRGVTPSGGKRTLRSLKKATIEKKQKSKDSRIRRNASKPLVGTGSMINLVTEKATKAKQIAKLYAGKKRAYKNISKAYYSNATPFEVGGYHQRGDGVPKREWFGISKEAEKKIVRMVSFEMDKKLARARA
jgi:hypothetical protein|tara:strand:- start:50 stop:559 length:510 start_codon:yes stop_codon:yes gene_type:complete